MKKISLGESTSRLATFYIIGLCLIIFLAVSTVTPIQAQTSSESLVLQKQDLDQEITEVERTYRGQLEEYRQYHQQYVVAKEQFKQLNTLASLEATVQTTKKAMLSRDQVLQTYLTLMRLELLNAEGINLNLKETAVNGIESAQKAVSANQDALNEAQDRASLNTAADDFDKLKEPITFVTTFSLQVLKTAKLQAVYDKSVVFLGDLQQQLVATDSPSLAQNQQERALNQIEQHLNDTQTQFAKIYDSLNRSVDNLSQVNITQNLNEVFASLTQAERFLKEIFTVKGS